MTGTSPTTVAPSAYAPPRPRTRIDLWLASNEGIARADQRSVPATELSRYPDTRELEADLAARFGVGPDRVLVTAGADDALLRVALAFASRGRALVLPTPTFEMIPRYVAIAGGVVRAVQWPSGAFPVQDVLRASRGASAIAVVSPNNPTGAVATERELLAVAEGASHALCIVDAAYAEFAEEDLTSAALQLPNAVVLRTFSKAYGAAGLRVGYVMGPSEVIAALRAAGNPYPVATPSIAYARAALDPARGATLALDVAAVRRRRQELSCVLTELGVAVTPSQASFVLVRTRDAALTADVLASLGVAVRRFPDDPTLADALRITVPTSDVDLARLTAALRVALRPEAVLFDLDGVLADVSRSYRAAILATAATYGVTLTDTDVQRAKDRGAANDDWELTHRLIRECGAECALDEVTLRFEALYQGTAERPGLRARERLLVQRDELARLAQRMPLAIVTGRPRRDAEVFLREHGIRDLFRVVVAREDAPLKPDPAPVVHALAELGVQSAWMLGDTPDDIVAARAAGVAPFGVLAGADPEALESSALGTPAFGALEAAGAARVLSRPSDLLPLVP